MKKNNDLVKDVADIKKALDSVQDKLATHEAETILNRLYDTLELANREYVEEKGCNNDLAFGLETTQAYLEEELQQLGYIDDELSNMEHGDPDLKILNIPYLQNCIAILFQAIQFNISNIKEVLNNYYEVSKNRQN